MPEGNAECFVDKLNGGVPFFEAAAKAGSIAVCGKGLGNGCSVSVIRRKYGDGDQLEEALEGIDDCVKWSHQ